MIIICIIVKAADADQHTQSQEVVSDLNMGEIDDSLSGNIKCLFDACIIILYLFKLVLKFDLLS